MDIIQQIRIERRWYFKAQLVYLYHNAMVAEFGNKRGDKNWTISDTASALEISSGYISESLKLVKYFENRDLAQMSREDALKEMKNGK